MAYGNFDNEHLDNQETPLSSTYSLGSYANREIQRQVFPREEQNGWDLHRPGLNPLCASKAQQRRTWMASSNVSRSFSADVFPAVFPSKGTRFTGRLHSFWKEAHRSLPIKEHLLTHWCFVQDKHSLLSANTAFLPSPQSWSPSLIKGTQEGPELLLSSSLWRFNFLGSVNPSGIYVIV